MMKPLYIKQSENQGKALGIALAQVGEEQSSFVRDAIRKACKELDIDYPDDLPGRGKYLRKTKGDEDGIARIE